MAICFSDPQSPGCNGPKPDVTEDDLDGVMCDYCASLRPVILKAERENRKRILRIGRMRRDRDLSVATMHRRITEEVEKALRRVWRMTLTGGAPCKYAFLVCGSIARKEPVTYSDIDALLVIEDDRYAEHFKNLGSKMHKALLLAGGQETQFKFCPGGLSPVYICGTPESVLGYIDENAQLGNTHLYGAMQTRMVLGDVELFGAYEDACRTKLRGHVRKKDRVRPPCNPTKALDNLDELLARRDVHFSMEGFRAPTDDDLIVNLKSQLYRPIHLVMTELGLFYGVAGWSTREIISNLVEAKRMSVECAHWLFNSLDDVGRLRIERQLEAGTEYEIVRLREIVRSDVFEDERDEQLARNEPLASDERIAAVKACAKRVRLFWEMTEHFVAMQRAGMLADWDVVGRIRPMSVEEFRGHVGLKGNRRRSMFSRKPHALQVISDKLAAYHALSSPMLKSRHELLLEMKALCEQHLARKHGKRRLTVKARALASLAYQAESRLLLEITRARDLANKINRPTQHVKPVGGHGGAIRFERAAKPGKVAVSGVELMSSVEHGRLRGRVELQDDDELDLYALRKLLHTLDGEKLRELDLKALEYADTTTRRDYRVVIEHERLVWEKTSKPVHTLDTVRGDPPRTALFAMDLDGRLFARNFDSQDRRGEFAHSSFLAGEEALGAGCIKVQAGRILEITNTSGHYQPRLQHLLDVCREICDVYDPRPEGHAVFGDFAFELEATRRGREATGFYRIPLLLFCDQGAAVPDILDFECKNFDEGGHWEYVAPGKALARGVVPERMDQRQIRLGMSRLKREL